MGLERDFPSDTSCTGSSSLSLKKLSTSARIESVVTDAKAHTHTHYVLRYLGHLGVN